MRQTAIVGGAHISRVPRLLKTIAEYLNSLSRLTYSRITGVYPSVSQLFRGSVRWLEEEVVRTAIV